MPPKSSEKTPGGEVPLRLIFGEDDFAVKQRAKAVYEEWCRATGGFDNEVLDAGAGNSGEALAAIGRLREAMQTLPFFGGGKVVWFQGCNFLGDERTATSSAVTEVLAELAQEFKEFKWEGLRLLITSGKVDKRKTFYKTIEKIGAVETFAGLSVEDKDWADQAEIAVVKQFRGLGKEIADDALGFLVSNVGPNTRLLANEVEKVALFVGDRPRVNLEDVEVIVTRNKQAKAFALADALGSRNLPRLLKILDQELWATRSDSSKSEIGLLYGIISKVRTMLFLKEMIREGWIPADAPYGRFKSMLERVPAEELPADRKFNPLAMHPFMLYNALGQTRNYSSEELVKAMELLLQCNLRLISSQTDPGAVIQETLVRIAGPRAMERAA